MARRRHRGAIAALACVAVLLCGAVPAQASFHLVRIRAIRAGAVGTAYLQLQETAAAENLVSGQHITVYDNGGNVMHDFPLPSNFSNATNQATILVASGPVDGVTPDFPDPTLSIPSGGGAVCYGIYDCVGYGMIGPFATPSPFGTPAVQSTGLGAGQTLVRSIAAGCSTLFETSDDTNNSAADFSIGPWTPRDGNSPITEKPCTGGGGKAPNTKIRKRPANRSTDTSPTFKFTSTKLYSTFKCKLDHKPFHKCHSPKTYHGLHPGKHVFKVEAIDSSGNVDKTPAKDKFTILP
jgi:hypothetical protein